MLKKSKIVKSILSVSLCSAVFFSCSTSAQDSKDVKTEFSMENEIDKVSYSLGVNIAQNVKSQGLDNINVEAFSAAIKDVYAGSDLKLDVAEAGKVLNEYFQKQQQAKLAENAKEGIAFLEANKSKEGVVTLPSGLQYQIMVKGTGAKPALTDKVKTHYHGTLIDGTVFDSSVDRGEPISFPVNGVIAGWTEALQLMPVGSKWKLFIPSNLAYGERGSGAIIGPNAALVFEVELLDIEK